MRAKRLNKNVLMSSDHVETYLCSRKRVVSVLVCPDHMLDVPVGTPQELVPIACVIQVMDRLAEISEIDIRRWRYYYT